MKRLGFPQGSEKWHELRRSVDGTASEAAAMMGASSRMSRDELLSMKKFGREKEISSYVEKFIFPKGHEVEALARPIAEKIINDTLFPITGVETVDGLVLLASFDGITLLEDIVFEHKQWNEKLAECVRAEDLDQEHYWQLEQQLLISKAEKVLFVVSDGTEEKMEYMWYRTTDNRQNWLIAGWKQFKLDLELHEHIEEEVKPAAKSIIELPALDIQIRGEVKSSNLAVYKDSALSFIENINTDLQTDQDFVDAENAVKFCGNAEKQLEFAKKQILSQAADIDLVTRTLDTIKEEMRSKRLMLEKLVKAEKDARKSEILQETVKAFTEHLKTVSDGMEGDYLPPMNIDVAGAMKGKKTMVSLRSAANDELARAKIAVNEVADKIRKNIKAFHNASGPEYPFLFMDMKVILQKESDDFLLLVRSRINEHKAAEERKLEAERVRIRAEEQAKAEAEQRKKSAEEQAERDREARELREKEAAEQAENDRVEREQVEKDRKERAATDAGTHRQNVDPAGRKTVWRANTEKSGEPQGQDALSAVTDGPPVPTVTVEAVSQSLMDNGIGKTTAKKVAVLILDGKIDGVIAK